MKDMLLSIINKYLQLFPDEFKRQEQMINFLKSHNDEEIADWNNFDGHIVATGFIYALKEGKFLVLHHKDLNMLLCPGGHMDQSDANPLVTAKRETEEETGIDNLKQLKIVNDDQLVPFDIDTHFIKFNQRLNLPEHYHFDFRYIFMIDKIKNVKIDVEESSSYKWLDIEQLYTETNYGKVLFKIKRILSKNKLSTLNRKCVTHYDTFKTLSCKDIVGS